MATYQTILTAKGKALIAAALIAGKQVQITTGVVGDGGGNPTTPDPNQTTLVRQVFQAQLNSIGQNPQDPTLYTAELIIPASIGGFNVREIGLRTSDGDLFAVGNMPLFYKPTTADGSYADTTIVFNFRVSDAGTVNIVVDPNISIATRTFVVNYCNAANVIPGGLTNQFLAKRTNNDGDVQWVDPTAAVEVIVDTIEERQTLAASQTVVNLSKVTTGHGLAVYIEGVRLDNTEWTPTSDTQITLMEAHPDGHTIVMVQNEQTGATDVLYRSNNLSDVMDKVASLKNLGAVSKTGDTMTGNLGIDASANPVAGNAGLVMNKYDGGGTWTNFVQGGTAGEARWQVHFGDQTKEAGSNAGSDFRIDRFDDNGNFITNALRIARKDGTATLNGTLNINAGGGAGGAYDYPYVYGQKNGKNRWAALLGDSTPENGAGGGSNFVIARYRDDGSWIDSPFNIDRSSALFTINTTGINVNTPQIGTGLFAGNSPLVFRTTSFNVDTCGFIASRNTAGGSSWDTVDWLLRRQVDSTVMGTLTFGNPSAGNAVVLTQGDGSYAKLGAGGQFRISGTCWAAGGFQVGSSRKLKTKLRKLGYGLAAVLGIETKRGYYKKAYNNDGRERLFVVAENLQEVVPQAVLAEGADFKGGKVPSVDYMQLVPVLIEAIKELNAKVEKLEAKAK